jgi:hypothetical protein
MSDAGETATIFPTRMQPLVGGYSFCWISADEVKITRDYSSTSEVISEAVMAGGDFETLMSCAFLSHDVQTVWKDNEKEQG